MPGLDPGIHRKALHRRGWIAESSPAMTADGLVFRTNPVGRHPSDVTASLAARHVQGGIVELQGGVADQRMDLAAVDAGSVDAGLREFIPPVLVALVDENVVVDPARDHVKLGMRDMSRGELGVLVWRRLGIAR